MRIDFSSPGAFAPFYDQTVAVRGAVQSGTFACCAFEEGLEDPLSPASPESNRRHIVVHLPKRGEGGWNHAAPPKIGDKVTVLSWGGIEGVDDFGIISVADFSDAWILNAREEAS